jgi:hypothetical protein
MTTTLARWARGPLAAAVFFTSLAQANLVLNGSFEQTSATTTSQFLSVTVNNWANSNTAGEAIVLPSWFTNGCLFSAPCNANSVTFAAPVTQTSPDGGNFVFSDGNFMNSAIKQTLTGLTPSTTYQLSFWQALSQDKELNITIPGPVTGYWQVTLGSSTLNSQLMQADGSTQTWSPWKQETMFFTAQNATEVLSFLSVGTGDPPLVLLDGVSMVAVPAPGAFALMSSAVALLGGIYRRTRWRQLTGKA